MKKNKKIVVLAFALVIVLAGLYVLIPGFMKVGSACIFDYAVSDDGTEMTIQVGVASSIGYIRKVSVHQQPDGKLCMDCYSAFGGINGSIGAKSKYIIPLSEDANMVAIYRDNNDDNDNDYEPVLEKDALGVWQWVDNKYNK